jgi:hypothetical protein
MGGFAAGNPRGSPAQLRDSWNKNPFLLPSRREAARTNSRNQENVCCVFQTILAEREMPFSIGRHPLMLFARSAE